MKSARIIFILFLAMCLPFIAGSEDRTIKRNKPFEERIALVIGNGNYRNVGTLKNPVNDAKDMAGALKKLGFRVAHRENAEKKEMEDAVREFGRQLQENRQSVGLFYYAGHGMQMNGRNYLIPVEAKIESESEVEYESVDAGRILGKMNDAGNRMNIVILDACRDNKFARSFRSQSNQGLAPMKAPTGSLIIFATAENEVASDNSYGKNGLFTESLLKHIATLGLEIRDVVMNVRNDLIEKTDSKQVPWEHSSLTGKFYFADSGSIATEKPQIPAESAKPKQATLNIAADVSGAEVWVNGNKQGVLPRNFTISESGKYEVEVTAPGYKKYRTSKNIEVGKEYEVAVHLEKEQVEVSSVPVYTPPVSQSSSKKPNYHLRSEPMTVSQDEALTVFKLKKDMDNLKRPLEYIENDFRNNGDGTITDHATGLMWQKSGSDKQLMYERAKAYIEEINRRKFAGYNDWRLPTVDELKSLLTPKKMNGDLHINPIFGKTKPVCWTSDKAGPGDAWLIVFSSGYIRLGDLAFDLDVRAVRSLMP